MQYWNTIHDSDVAPSPIVPTYRPDPPPKWRNSSMPSPTSAAAEDPRPSVGNSPRPQARSAGMAERPGRNENLSDLVRFFQTQNTSNPPVVTSPDSTTALPIVHSPPRESLEKVDKIDKVEKTEKEQLKPLHRRLMQFTQRQKKESSSSSSSSPRSKQDEQQKQIEALMREGYLFSSSKKPTASSKSVRSTRSKNSVDYKSIDRASISSSTRHDVETIGQPWLEKEKKGDGPNIPGDQKRRLASLDLGDFGSMLNVAVSLTSTDDLSPSSYRPSQGNQHSASHPASALPRSSSSSDIRPHNAHRASPSLASTIDTQGSGSGDGFTRRFSCSTNSSVRAADHGSTSSLPAPSNPSACVHTSAPSDQSVNGDSKQEQDPAKATDRVPSNPPSLKLFPDVSPQVSSKNAWRLSAVPRYQTPLGKPLSAKDELEAPAPVQPVDKEQPSENASLDTKEVAELVCSSALEAPRESAQASKVDIPTSKPVPTPAPAAKSQVKPRPQSLALGTLQAFPLPAPNRPLPSIPDARRAPSTHLEVKANPTIRVMRSGSGLRIMDLQPSQPSPIAEDPQEPEARPATALGYVGGGDALEIHESPPSRISQARSKSTDPEQPTPRRRSSSVRAPRMQDLHESAIEVEGGSETPGGEPIADSPVLGRQHTLTKPHGKRHPGKELHIDSLVDRKNLPFGLPSPPPTASLPTNPPQAPVERSARHRNFTAPSGVPVPSVRNLDHHRASTISRSDSSRSSLRHESIPESYEPNHCESPIPSSDDEGFGPHSQSVRGRRPAEKYPMHKEPVRRGYEALDARPSHGRLRYSHQSRPLTPQGRSSHGHEKTSSPQSQYSQSTHRSRESQNSYRADPARGPPSNFLEDRITNLERQNQVLQAALMAALNAGVVKNHMEDLPDASMSPMFSSGGMGNHYQQRHTSRPESWVSSSRSSEHSGFETPSSLRDRRADVRQLDNMIEDIESGWLSDKSSLSGPHMARHR